MHRSILKSYREAEHGLFYKKIHRGESNFSWTNIAAVSALSPSPVIVTPLRVKTITRGEAITLIRYSLSLSLNVDATIMIACACPTMSPCHFSIEAN